MERARPLRQFLDTVPVLIWCAEADGGIRYVNKVWLDFTGRTLQQELGRGWTEGIHPDDHDATSAAFAAHSARREPFRIEFRLRRHDGTWRCMLSAGVPREDQLGRLVSYIGSCTDITDLHEAEAQRQRDLDEKQAVMQELHHRVKNNAQVFASLLSVQASRAADPSVKAALRVAASRASTMALAQQQIWSAGSSARFDLGELVRRLSRAQVKTGIDVEVHAPGTLFVPLATAVPLGLIIHELLSNALTHGFPKGGHGRVDIRLQHNSGQLRVVVADSGCGMPPESDTVGRAAGLTIVRSLARQLGATMTVDVAEGTTVGMQMSCPSPGCSSHA
jgi:PAS domain S-box-containing protein